MVDHVSSLVISICALKRSGSIQSKLTLFELELRVQWVAALMCLGLLEILILRHVLLVSAPFTERSVWSDSVCLLSNADILVLDQFWSSYCYCCVSFAKIVFLPLQNSVPLCLSSQCWCERYLCMMHVSSLWQIWNRIKPFLRCFTFVKFFPLTSPFWQWLFFLALWRLSSNRECSHNFLKFYKC